MGHHTFSGGRGRRSREYNDSKTTYHIKLFQHFHLIALVFEVNFFLKTRIPELLNSNYINSRLSQWNPDIHRRPSHQPCPGEADCTSPFCFEAQNNQWFLPSCQYPVLPEDRWREWENIHDSVSLFWWVPEKHRHKFTPNKMMACTTVPVCPKNICPNRFESSPMRRFRRP